MPKPEKVGLLYTEYSNRSSTLHTEQSEKCKLSPASCSTVNFILGCLLSWKLNQLSLSIYSVFEMKLWELSPGFSSSTGMGESNSVVWHAKACSIATKPLDTPNHVNLTKLFFLSAATWRRWHNDRKLWSGQILATEYTWRSWSWKWHSAADPHTWEQYSRIVRTIAL